MGIPGRFSHLILLIILAAGVASVFFSILYFVPSTSSYHSIFTHIFDGLFFLIVIIGYWLIRQKISPYERFANEPDPRLIYSTMINDTDTEEYKRRLKMACELYLQDTINTEEEFFWHVGVHTAREERVFNTLKDAKAKFRKLARY